MKRANGKTDEAITLYREILAADETDLNARTGLVLSLFDAGKKTEAETEMQKTLEANAGNLPLLVGAAYWYAGNNEGVKAIDLAQKALAVEPRYTWANIALARGLIAEKRPLDAEKVLLAARNYGNFPTLDYEIAVARVEAGFYREAADELKKKFRRQKRRARNISRQPRRCRGGRFYQTALARTPRRHFRAERRRHGGNSPRD